MSLRYIRDIQNKCEGMSLIYMIYIKNVPNKGKDDHKYCRALKHLKSSFFWFMQTHTEIFSKVPG